MTEFVLRDYQEVRHFLRICDISLGSTRLYWSDSVAFGKYLPRANQIHISSACKQGIIMWVVPCIVHELTHKLQRKRAGSLIAYYIGLSLFRWAWEKEAIAAEEEAERMLGIEL